MKVLRLFRDTAMIRSFQISSRQPLRTFSRFSIRTGFPQSTPCQRLSITPDIARQSISRSIKHTPRRNFHGTTRKSSADPTPNLGSPEPSLSLSQRFRKLSREYGWSAVGVYLALSALDFPFCFVAVRWLGTDRIGHWEHVAVEWFWTVVPWPFPKPETETVVGKIKEEVGDSGWGVVEADKANRSDTASTL